MHELSYILDIIDTVNERKMIEGAEKVTKIVVEVGKMAGIVPFYLNKYFDEVKAEASLDEAQLEVIEMEVKIKCSGCDNIYTPDKANRYKCPVCGERSGDLIQGKGITIREIVVEDSE